MAKYERMGYYCPLNEFYDVRHFKDVQPNWWKAEELLGPRKSFMAYGHGTVNKQRAFIVDAIQCGEGTLGIEIASLLEQLIPHCDYEADEGRMILCEEFEEESEKIQEDPDFLLEDERYVVMVKDCEEYVKVDLLRK